MSEKPVTAKLLIKPGAAVWVSDAARASLLGPLPDGARLVASPGEAGVAVVISDDAAAIRATLTAHLDVLASRPVLWVAYPKGGRADINRDSLWRLLAPHGLRPITQVAIDETWSALRFRPLRPDEVEVQGGVGAGA
jgi:hypothetical protein